MEKMTIDHVVPVGAGGKADEKNLVVACHTCNRNKADRIIQPMTLAELEAIFYGFARPRGKVRREKQLRQPSTPGRA
jgi:5-methylcytosine-specific restriction endonuclease McrA